MIRRMGKADVPAITRLDALIFGPEAWTAPEFEHEMNGPDRLYLVWEGVDPTRGQIRMGKSSPSTVLGYTGVWTGGPSAHILTLAVAPDVRRHGIGTALLSAAAQQSRLAGCQELRLEVRVDNLAAIRLYTNLGFHRVGYEPHYYQPEDVDAYLMAYPFAQRRRSASKGA